MDYKEEDDPGETPGSRDDDERVEMTGRKFLLAFFLPFLLDLVLTRLLTEAAIFGWVLAAWVGFYFLTKGCRPRTQGLIALVYFPFMLFVFAIAAFLVPGFSIPIHGE